MNNTRVVNLNTDNVSNNSAHTINLQTIAFANNGVSRHVIFKHNKYSGLVGQNTSTLEACFTALTNLFCLPSHTLQQELVLTNQNEIVGVSTEHAAYALFKSKAYQHNKLAHTSTPLSPHSALGQQEFDNWLCSIKPLNLETEKWAELKQDESSIDRTQQAITQKLHSLNKFIEQEQHKSPLNIHQLKEFCLDLVQHKKDLIIEDIPLVFQSAPQLVHLVFEYQWLRFHSEQNRIKNSIHAKKIALVEEKKGFNFLDKLPKNFFSLLLHAKKTGKIDLDMNSLADVFATAYGLEEDDLHKGNLGYYITIGEHNRPCFHFFKIDNDLMLINKIMSARNAIRINQYHYSARHYNINPMDLVNFPDLRHSANHYWPTKTSFFTRGTKAYHNTNERQAFQSLKNDSEFKQAKWQRLLKQIIIPDELLIATLHHPLKVLHDEHASKEMVSLIERAVSARMSELRITLLSVPEFRDYLKTNEQSIKKILINEIKQQIAHLKCDKKETDAYILKIEHSLHTLVTLSKKNVPLPPIHNALITKSYLCYNTAIRFKEELNNKDAEGHTTLDYAIERYKHFSNKLIHETGEKNKRYSHEMRTYYADIIWDLHLNNAQYTQSSQEQYKTLLIMVKQHHSSNQLPIVTTLAEYKKIIEQLRAQPRRSLKQDKVDALQLLEKASLNEHDLQQLKHELHASPTAAPLKFIKELRSDLWVIKYLRGAYGYTSTLAQMSQLINTKLQKIEPEITNSP